MRIRSLKSLYSNKRFAKTNLSAPRVRRKGQGPEASLLKEIKETLQVLKGQGLLGFRRIHVMPVIRNGRVTSNPDQMGMEDLQIYLLGGRTLYWELKSPTGKQSENQKSRETELISLGHSYKVIRSLEQAISELSAKGLSLFARTKEPLWSVSKT